MISLYLLHVTAAAHSEKALWTSLACNLFVVASGVFFIYKLFKQQNIKKAGITFAIAILINYIMIAIYGDVFDLLG